MAQRMLAYTREQASVWRAILDGRKALAGEFVKAFQDAPLQRFVLVGAGSSYTAAQFAKEILERLLQVEATVAVPTRIGTLLPLLPRSSGAVFFAISQSGRSTNTEDATKKIRASGHLVTAVTANPQSPVAQLCGSCVPVLCGEETVGPKTKGMTATALTLTLLGMELALAKGILSAETYKETIAAFYRAADCAAENVEAGIAWCAQHKELAKAPHMILVADGMTLPAAMEGALKVLETLYIPVFAYEFEEYLHGVGNTINADSWLVFLSSDTGDRQRIMRLYEFAGEHGSHNYMISAGTPAGCAGELFLNSSGNELTLPFETLMPFHAISALLSEEKGINCDLPQFSDFAQRLNTKAQ